MRSREKRSSGATAGSKCWASSAFSMRSASTGMTSGSRWSSAICRQGACTRSGTTCTVLPSAVSAKATRRLACRSSTACAAARRRPGSTAPSRSSTNWIMYASMEASASSAWNSMPDCIAVIGHTSASAGTVWVNRSRSAWLSRTSGKSEGVCPPDPGRVPCSASPPSARTQCSAKART
ncbi:Uncharacterised protein [Mycobacteroides abscessus subsp. abscessus]|nr:Uncharacterised protein [Mycobacteroides abscessus subsp. abscessus]